MAPSEADRAAGRSSLPNEDDESQVTSAAEQRRRWEERYSAGNTPWDTGITPPEVLAFWAHALLPRRGRVMDLGCGTGTNLIFLARLGLHAVGLEHAGRALQLARQRLQSEPAAVQKRVDLIRADVTRWPLRGVQAHYILDIGCLHGLALPRRPAYAKEIIDNLVPGGFYQLFAFDRVVEADNAAGNLRGMAAGEVAAMFAPWLQVVEVVEGTPDRQPCRWYLLQRT